MAEIFAFSVCYLFWIEYNYYCNWWLLGFLHSSLPILPSVVCRTQVLVGRFTNLRFITITQSPPIF